VSEFAEVLVPANEEGTKATVLRWCKQVGETVGKDEPLLELETDKVTVEIASPAAGELYEMLKKPDEEVFPGDLLARVRTGAGAGVGAGAGGATAPSDESARPPLAHVPAAETGRPLLSPAVRKLLGEHTLRAEDVEGSGREGRITVEDVVRHVGGAAPMRVAHTPMRRRIAEHMLQSVLRAPHVTTLFEADLTRVQAHRRRHAKDFERQGVRLTLSAYFIAACARALVAHPKVNASFHEDAMDLHADANIGVGTALGEEGLIVPVIHRAQALDLLSIGRRLGELVSAARAGKLKPEDVRGGTFTISNHGVGGSLLAAPIIINQPQIAILGIGKVERRVCVVETQGEEAIAVRSLCYLTLTIDHRAIDAFQANAFLSTVVGTLQEWP
jgi:2-oxoglutarate dehydrogenase E2 component (dihydrolipoamide succinyltransferase)